MKLKEWGERLLKKTTKMSTEVTSSEGKDQNTKSVERVIHYLFTVSETTRCQQEMLNDFSVLRAGTKYIKIVL